MSNPTYDAAQAAIRADRSALWALEAAGQVVPDSAWEALGDRVRAADTEAGVWSPEGYWRGA